MNGYHASLRAQTARRGLRGVVSLFWPSLLAACSVRPRAAGRLGGCKGRDERGTADAAPALAPASGIALVRPYSSLTTGSSEMNRSTDDSMMTTVYCRHCFLSVPESDIQDDMNCRRCHQIAALFPNGERNQWLRDDFFVSPRAMSEVPELYSTEETR